MSNTYVVDCEWKIDQWRMKLGKLKRGGWEYG